MELPLDILRAIIELPFGIINYAQDIYNALNALPFEDKIASFVVGVLGSYAYVTALFFGFVAESSKKRDLILKPFVNKLYDFQPSKLNVIRTLWYCSMGGVIASLFQFTISNFAPIQSLIIGAAWPSTILPYLSGRMMEANKIDLEALGESSGVEEKQSNLVKGLTQLIKEAKKN